MHRYEEGRRTLEEQLARHPDDLEAMTYLYWVLTLAGEDAEPVLARVGEVAPLLRVWLPFMTGRRPACDSTVARAQRPAIDAALFGVRAVVQLRLRDPGAFDAIERSITSENAGWSLAGWERILANFPELSTHPRWLALRKRLGAGA